MKDDRLYVLSFDIGTQSTRALLINANGEILYKYQVKHNPAYHSPHTDWAEQDPEFYFERLSEASLGLKALMKDEEWECIGACVLTTIRATTVVVDKKGKPLYPAILWLDRRRVEKEPTIPALSKLLFKAVKMQDAIITQWKVSPYNWFKENRPDIIDKMDKFLLLSGYLTFRLSGEMKDAVSSMVGYVPFDHKNRKWMKSKSLTRFIFDVEREKLCDVVEAGEILGYITEEASEATGLRKGLPIIASGADKACETLGMGCTGPGKAAISFGTTATVSLSTDCYVEPERYVPAYAAVIPGYFNPEIEIFRGYWLISWFKREFAAKEVAEAEKQGISPEELLNSRLKEISPGSEGLVFQPYFTPNITKPFARGAVIGFSDAHTRIHIYRAIIEGINFALMNGLHEMQKRTRGDVNEIFLGGGGSQSDEICQMTADMFGIPTCRTQTYEVAGIGSAMAAFIGLGIFTDYDQAARSMVHLKDRFEPNMEHHRIYQKIYREIFLKIYGRLAPLYHLQQGINDLKQK